MDTNQSNPFSSVFSGSEPKPRQIELALELLYESLDKPMNPKMAKAWASQLQALSGEQLAVGFRAATLNCDGFPKPKDVMHAIWDSEFPVDYAWLLAKLTIHRPEWRDRGPVYCEIYRNPDIQAKDGYLRDEIEPAQWAPPMPARLKAALEIFGTGSMTDGLTLLYKHPNCGRIDYDALETLRVRRQLDDSFRAAWTQARTRELV